MFVDQVSVYVKAGDGGNGLVAYRREKYVPKGGPAGGDGGNGANIVFKVDEGLNTLMDFRYNRHFKGKRGENGMSKTQHGKNAAAYVIPVPPGTTVIDEDTGEVIADLTNHEQEAVIARGGREEEVTQDLPVHVIQLQIWLKMVSLVRSVILKLS